MLDPSIRAGQAVYFEWIISTPGQVAQMFDPSPPPTINIVDPTGALVVTAAQMSKLDLQGNRLPCGVWSFTYQTPPSGVLGTWQVWVDAVDRTGAIPLPGGSQVQNAFELIPPGWSAVTVGRRPQVD